MSHESTIKTQSVLGILCSMWLNKGNIFVSLVLSFFILLCGCYYVCRVVVWIRIRVTGLRIQVVGKMLEKHVKKKDFSNIPMT